MRTLDFGPRAHLLPGSEILDTFNPLEYPLSDPDAKAIAIVPGDSSCLVRWYPHQPLALGSIPLGETDIYRHITKAQWHFQGVMTASDNILEVPSHRSFVAAHPANAARLAIVSVVETVSGTKHSQQTKDSRTAPVLYALSAYLQWVINTSQTDILSDIFSPKQCLTGPPHYLTDIDGMLNSTPSGQQGIMRYVKLLAGWRARLPDMVYTRATDQILGHIARQAYLQM